MTTPHRFLSAMSLAVALSVAPSALRAADMDETAGLAHQVLRKYCRQCHAGPADRVKGDLQVLDLAALHRRKVVRDGKPAESELFQLVECGSMPPGGLPKPGPAEVDVLREWIGDGAPDFPPEYGDGYVMKQIEKDLAAVNARNPKDVKYQRYVSFNHLLAEGADPEPDLWQAALLKALNHLSWEPNPAGVTPIDPPANTIFRFDERDLGWQLRPFAPDDFDLFDLLLLEYPYATLPSRFDGEHHILAVYLRDANPVRPILYVRGDWLVSTATQPPLYEDLLRLPRTLAGKGGLEGKIQAGAKGVRAVFPNSKMTGGPQLVERRDDAVVPAMPGAYWRTFDPGAARDLNALLRAPDADRGGLMLFSLPNGLNGYYIAESVPDDGGKRLVRLTASAPAEWVADPNATDRIARNGLSCMRCHEQGVEALADASGAVLADLPAADKAPLLPLFPGKEAVDKLLAGDALRFQTAVAAVHKGPLDREPLTPVTRRYFQMAQAGPIAPAFLTAGAGVAATPVVAVGAGVRDLAHFPAPDLDAPPLRPLDGLTLPDYQPPLPPVDVTIASFRIQVNPATKKVDPTTKTPTKTFHDGDDMVIEVKNQGANEAYVEIIGLSPEGRMVVHQPPTLLGSGKTYNYPHDRPVNPADFVEMGLPPGVDRYILFAADKPFPAGIRLRGPGRERRRPRGASVLGNLERRRCIRRVRPDASRQEDAGRRDPVASVAVGRKKTRAARRSGGSGDGVVELGLAGEGWEKRRSAPGSARFGKALDREDGEASAAVPNLLADGGSARIVGGTIRQPSGRPDRRFCVSGRVVGE